MSYAITPFSVSIARVRQVFGSHDRALAHRLKVVFDFVIEQDAQDYDEGDDEWLSLEDALDQVIEGWPLQAPFGDKYGYVLEMLCWHFGTDLPNDAFSQMQWEWAEEIEKVLAESGVPGETFSLLHHMMLRGSPVPIPSPANFPRIGYLTLDEITPAVGAIVAINVAALEPDHRNAVLQLKRWLETCLKAQTDLVCFYH